MPRRSQRAESGHTVLLVDDQEETLLSLRTLLEREGHRVLTATSGERALAIVKESDVHLLLVDYVMPHMNGAELVREVRAFDPYVQIILQTGYSGEKPPQAMLAELDIQGYHDKADGPDKLLMWVTVGLKAYQLIQRLRERERLQGELVANVSHELRTPLNIIGGYASLLLDGHFGGLPPDALPPLRALGAATRNLTDLVSDFLQYAKADAGVCDKTPQRLATDELVRELERLGGLLLEGKDVRFTVEADEAPAAFVTDAVKLRTILRNLVTNAVKFTTQGTIRVRFAARGAGLCVTVSDTGSGIRPEEQALIFEPFRQGDSSSTRSHGGIGLGLALSRKYARLLGGELELQHTSERGSCFALFLPAALAAERGRVDSRPRERVAAMAAA